MTIAPLLQASQDDLIVGVGHDKRLEHSAKDGLYQGAPFWFQEIDVHAERSHGFLAEFGLVVDCSEQVWHVLVEALHLVAFALLQ